MARALQLSLASDAGPPSDNVPPTQTQQEEADLALARALAQSEDEQRRQQNQVRSSTVLLNVFATIQVF